MANQETQLLDDLIVKNRRKMLTLGATSLAGMLFGGAFEAKAQSATYTDADILNFALNLEYLEASFYYQAAFGTTIDVANAASTAAKAPVIPLGTTTGAGTVGTYGGPAVGGSKVPFTTIQAASYAIETAVEEGKHVATLLGALSTAAVAMPQINIGTSFQMLGSALTPAVPTFTPYKNDAAFLLGAYIFEDVGVTAYHGAASLLTVAANLSVAAGILGVEAYHAGLIRTTLNYLDPDGSQGLVAVTTSISNLRAALSLAGLLGVTPSATTSYDVGTDDFGLATFTTTVGLGGGSPAVATRIVDADSTDVVAFARNPTQVLNIVTGGGAVSADGKTAVSPAVGIFFPAGLNAGSNGFK